MDTPALTGRVPFIVGVTGHRDIRERDVPLLETEVRAVLGEIQTQHANSALVLLTPLADGADQLVARIAVSLGMRLVVPLPFAREEYEATLSEEGGKTFRQMIDGPAVVNTFCFPELDTRGRGFSKEDRQALQYALLGAYVSHHSDILIALWNGRPSRRLGGTAQVVQYRRVGTFDIERHWLELIAEAPEPFGVRESLLEPPDVGPLYHITTPRHGHPDGHPHLAVSRAYLLPSEYSPESTKSDAGAAYEHELRDIAELVAAFNADARKIETLGKSRVDASAQDLYPDPHSRTASTLPAGLGVLRRSFALADAMAIKFQRRVHRALFAISALIFAAALAFAFFAHGFNDVTGVTGARTMLGAYAGILIVADIVFLVTRTRGWQDKYQDFRAVAEALRVQFYWRLAGLPHSASDYYVRKQRDELSWIPRAVNACAVVAPALTSTDEIDQLNDVHTLWIKRQADYYDRARQRAQRGRRWANAGSGAVAVSLGLGLYLLWDRGRGWPGLRVVFAMALATVLFHVWIVVRESLARGTAGERRESGARDMVARLAGMIGALVVVLLLIKLPDLAPLVPGWELDESFLMMALGVAAVIGAVLHGYTDRRAFAELARHYGRMADVFARASRRLDELLAHRDAYRARALIIGLGKEALNEHGDWVMLHRERPIEPPEGGG